MHVGGVPLAQHPSGLWLMLADAGWCWLVLAFTAAVTAALAWLLLRLQ